MDDISGNERPDQEVNSEKKSLWIRIDKWVKISATGRRLKERLKSSPLLAASLKSIAGALATFICLWMFIGFAMHGFWTWGLGPGDTTRADAVRIVLTMIAGVGGIIYLTIAYRRQRGEEAGEFMSRLENAARQLGSADPMVQYAGIYALEALADENDHERKQLCVGVLCSYLRLPYQGGGKPSLLTEVVKKHTRHYASDSIEETRTHLFRPSDREVRLTIIRTITKHLQKDAPNSWSHLDFDFTGVFFDGGNFSGAVFSGGEVSFDGAVFSGGEVSFSRTVFSGGEVSFSRA